jgi:transposase
LHLLKSQILIAWYSVRSDRQFCEQLDDNLLLRRFLDMSADESMRARSLATETGCSSLLDDSGEELRRGASDEPRSVTSRSTAR